MDANLDKIALDLYGKIQTRFSDITIGDENANVLSKKTDIPKARFFEFEYKEDGEDIGTVAITLDTDDGIVIEVSGDIVEKQHPGAFKFIRSFRKFAKNRLLNYDVQRMGKSNLDKRDYQFRAKVKDNTIMENKLFGTARISYQDLGEARLVIKHSQPVNTELAAGRTMHIESIYIENAAGERFRYPTKHINGARALAEHIKHGGHPYDGIGMHICGLSEELASLRKFKNYVGRQTQLSEAMGEVTSKVIERIESVKKEIHNLQRSTYYEQFAESFESQDEQMIPEAVMDDWIDRLTIRTFNEELKSVFPYIYRLVDGTQLPVKELSADDLLAEDDKEDIAPWYKDKAEQDADKKQSAFKKKNNPNRTGKDAAKALAQKGIPKTESFDPEDQFENFMNGIAEGNDEGLGIFDKNEKVRNSAIQELNRIFQAPMTGGPGANINIINTLSKYLPEVDPLTGEALFPLDALKKADPELDVRATVQLELERIAQDNDDIAEILNSNAIDFSGDEEIGGADDAGQEAPAPAAPEASAPAPEAPAPAPEEQLATPVAEGMASLKAKLIKAVECGAGPDTELDFGHKKMSLLSALQECGINPASVGFKSKESGVEEILKSISGFWNRDATITEGNFTIGPTRVITKIISNFKNGNFENATKEDVGRVIQMVKKMDPPSSVNQPGDELGHIKHLSGMHSTIDEASTESAEEFAKMMADFKAKHSDADIDELIQQYKDQESNNPNVAAQNDRIANRMDAEAGANSVGKTANTTGQGTIDGQPASHADAMAKFRDIAKGMKLKLPGADGQDMDFDFSDPDKMGSQLQSHVGNMMKGMMDKMPQGQQKLDMPGFSGSMDPQAMMKGMMDKMPNQAGNSASPSERLRSMDPRGNSEIPKADAIPKADEMGIYRPGVTRSVTGNEPTDAEQERIFRDMKGGVAPKNDMDFKPGNQSNLLQVDNPEYVARRSAALKKPGAVVGQTTMESAELTAMLKIAGLR
jgi:hypothetical protein